MMRASLSLVVFATSTLVVSFPSFFPFLNVNNAPGSLPIPPIQSTSHLPSPAGDNANQQVSPASSSSSFLDLTNERQDIASHPALDTTGPPGTGSISHFTPSKVESNLRPRKTSKCENSATSRNCWGDYSIDTDYYDTIPDTGVTREYWLVTEKGSCAPDGYNTTCLTFNGTMPGPTIIADWGDTLVIHVTNNIPDNGTSIHWHGLRQLDSVSEDGVPGVTQCPIAPGESMTYTFRVTQYGSTWYHSHFSLQYSEGLFGGMIFNGPATANYDTDLGVLFLDDWTHSSAFELWYTARQVGAVELENNLINGSNTYNCTEFGDDTCTGTLGSRFETVFTSGQSYLIRLINVATEALFQFSIDGHNLTVIANDLVPIEPYTTDSVLITIGQRYDVVVEAGAPPGDYWLRGGWVDACSTNLNAAGMLGVVRYADATRNGNGNGTGTGTGTSNSTADPTSTSDVTPATTCADEPYESLVPYLARDVGALSGDRGAFESLGDVTDSYFKWTLNSSSLYLDWADPTLVRVGDGESVFPTEYNVVAVNSTDPSANCSGGSAGAEWAVLIIEDDSGIGLTHPIHMHGHDFYLVGQATGAFGGDLAALNTTNPPRRDVVSLPGNGYVALAFQLDNPGAWLVHCHIAWHQSEGLALEIVEDESAIASVVTAAQKTVLDDVCAAWDAYVPGEEYAQGDSGI